MVTISERTAYPKIFQSCYWGNFSTEHNPHLLDFVENRNNFVEEFNIKRHIKLIPKYVREKGYVYDWSGWQDHRECYLTHDRKYIIIVSPRCIAMDSKWGRECLEAMNSWGYQHYNKLYSDTCETFYKIIPMR